MTANELALLGKRVTFFLKHFIKLNQGKVVCLASVKKDHTMFPYEPPLTQYLNWPKIKPEIRDEIGDIRQPWIDLAKRCDISAFSAKAIFTLGMMRRYIISANAVLMSLRFWRVGNNRATNAH